VPSPLEDAHRHGASGPRRQRRRKAEANPGPVPARSCCSSARDRLTLGPGVSRCALLTCSFSGFAIRLETKVIPIVSRHFGSQSAQRRLQPIASSPPNPVQGRSGWAGGDSGGRCDRSGPLAKRRDQSRRNSAARIKAVRRWRLQVL